MRRGIRQERQFERGKTYLKGGTGDDAVWGVLKCRRWRDGTKAANAVLRSASVRIIKIGAAGTAGNDSQWRGGA